MLILIKSEKIGHEFKLTYSDIPCWIDRLIGRKTRQREFVGAATIWRELPDFRRVDSLLESRLCDDAWYIESPFGSHLVRGKPVTLTAELQDGGKLADLMQALGTADPRDLMRTAFAMLDLLLDHQHQGGQVMLQNADGSKEALPDLSTLTHLKASKS